MSVRIPTEAEIRAQLPAIRARSRRAAAIEPRAVSAWYDADRDLIMMQLKSGAVFGFPPFRGDGLDPATAEQLAAVEIEPGGDGLHWEELDADISVPGIIYHLLGIKRWAASWRRSESRRR